jgi:hypothetical protein
MPSGIWFLFDILYVATNDKEKNRGHLIVRHGDFSPGRVAVRGGSAFVNSSSDQDLLTGRQSECDFDFDLTKAVTRMEAWPNTSTVNLRIIGGYKKGTLKLESIKYGRGSQGNRTRESLRW